MLGEDNVMHILVQLIKIYSVGTKYKIYYVANLFKHNRNKQNMKMIFSEDVICK